MWPVKDSQPSLKQLMMTLKKIILSHSYSSRNDVKFELCAVIFFFCGCRQTSFPQVWNT